MSDYIIGKVAPLMAGQLLPFVVFLVSTLMTFALVAGVLTCAAHLIYGFAFLG